VPPPGPQGHLKERLARGGVEAFGTPPEAFARYIKSEMSKWGKVVTAANVRVD